MTTKVTVAYVKSSVYIISLTHPSMEDDVVNPVAGEDTESLDDKELDPDMLEDSFDDVDPL